MPAVFPPKCDVSLQSRNNGTKVAIQHSPVNLQMATQKRAGWLAPELKKNGGITTKPPSISAEIFR
jgi:hypothetical protein